MRHFFDNLKMVIEQLHKQSSNPEELRYWEHQTNPFGYVYKKGSVIFSLYRSEDDIFTLHVLVQGSGLCSFSTSHSGGLRTLPDNLIALTQNLYEKLERFRANGMVMSKTEPPMIKSKSFQEIMEEATNRLMATPELSGLGESLRLADLAGILAELIKNFDAMIGMWKSRPGGFVFTTPDGENVIAIFHAMASLEISFYLTSFRRGYCHCQHIGCKKPDIPESLIPMVEELLAILKENKSRIRTA